MTRAAERVVTCAIQRGTAEQWINDGKNAVAWARLSYCSFGANAVRLQLHAFSYNLAVLLHTLALPTVVKQWSLTTLRKRMVRTGTRIVRHRRAVTFQMAEAMVPRGLFRNILGTIAALRLLPPAQC